MTQPYVPGHGDIRDVLNLAKVLLESTLNDSTQRFIKQLEVDSALKTEDIKASVSEIIYPGGKTSFNLSALKTLFDNRAVKFLLYSVGFAFFAHTTVSVIKTWRQPFNEERRNEDASSN